MKKILSLLLALALVFTLAACGTKDEPAAAAASFRVVVTDLDGNETTFEYTASADSLGEALVAEGLIAGHETEYGLYIDTVNDITADWDNDQTYWAFYINGEYATTGIDGTEIVADTTYGLTLTKG